jgi:hypothetical protein
LSSICEGGRESVRIPDRRARSVRGFTLQV